MESTNKYENGKIYMISSPNCPKLFYYGSTCEELYVRMNVHRHSSNSCTSKQIIECGDAEITLVEKFKCTSLKELNEREGWYQLNNSCVNKKIAGRSRQETQRVYYEKNKCAYQVYYENNKHCIKEYHRLYYLKNKSPRAEKTI